MFCFVCVVSFGKKFRTDTFTVLVTRRHAGTACGRRKAVVEFLLFGILPFFRIEFDRDRRGLGDRRIPGSISAGTPARTVAPAMSAMSLMFVIYIWLFFFCFLHADNSTLSSARIWDQSPTPRRVAVESRRGESRLN